MKENDDPIKNVASEQRMVLPFEMKNVNEPGLTTIVNSRVAVEEQEANVVTEDSQPTLIRKATPHPAFQIDDNQGRSLEIHKMPFKSGQIHFCICEICLEQVKEKKMKSIDRCSHLFCFGCLESHIKERLSQSQTVVPCPAEECKESLRQVSPIYNELEDSTKRMFRKKEGLNFILKNPGFQLCKRDECEGKFQISKDKNGNKCDICSADHCQKCFDLKHSNTCSSQLVAYLKDRQLFRQCKKCKFIIEKNNGCNHMTCLCGYQFCYQCGEDFVMGHVCQLNNQSLTERLHRSLMIEQPRLFEHKSLNLRSIYRFCRIQPQMSVVLKTIKFLVFILFIYPLLIIYGMLIFSAALIFYILGLCILIPIFPFSSIVNNTIGDTIQFQIGKRSIIMAIIFVVLLYPVLLLQTLILFIFRILKWSIGMFGDHPELRNELFEEIFQQIAIIIVLPCLI